MLQAVFTDGIDCLTVEGLTQWDVGQEIEIKLASLPATFQVHFSNKGEKEAYVVSAKATGGVALVQIPNVLSQSPKDAIAWIYVIKGEARETVKTIELPMSRRAKPSDYAYTETEILNYETVIAKAETFAGSASQSEANAKASATTASEAAAIAEEAKNYVNAIVAGNESYTKRESDIRYAPYIKGESRGQLIAIKDSADAPIISLDVESKNKIPYPYYETSNTSNEITWTDNGDGKVTANGTATANEDFILLNHTDKILEAGTYIINGMPEGSSNSTYYIYINWYENNVFSKVNVFTSKTTFTLTEADIQKYTFRVALRIVNGATVENLVFEPMIRPIEIEDDSYRVFADSEEVSVRITEENILPYPYANTTHTDYEVVWTDNGDGSITANGATPNNAAIFYCSLYTQNKPFKLPQGTYKLSGCPSGGRASNNTIQYFLRVYTTVDGVNTYLANDYGLIEGGVEFTLEEETAINCIACIYNNYTANNITFYPMIRPVEIEDNTWKPYNGITVSAKVGEKIDTAKINTSKPYTCIICPSEVYAHFEYVVDTQTYVDNKFVELQSALLKVL